MTCIKQLQNRASCCTLALTRSSNMHRQLHKHNLLFFGDEGISKVMRTNN